jgi:predicted dehydrogenase
MIALALIGCGGMGCRHIRGLRKLQEIDAQTAELVAVCDPLAPNAANAADLAADLLGLRPRQFSSLDDLLLSGLHVDAVLITTSPDLHAAVGIAAFAAGLHVMVEKPITLTVEDGASLIDAGFRADRILAVAENYRRDPINRLARALVERGVLGQVHLMVQSSAGSGEQVIITPWRHRKRSGGIVVDMGIHYADLVEFFAGPVTSVFGMSACVDHQRLDTNGTWHEADAEDLEVGVLRFANGAICNLMMDLAGRGESHFSRVIYGSKGSLSIPLDRTGKPLSLTLRRDGHDDRIETDELLAMVPEYHLDAITSRLFGGERVTSYEMEFCDIDANLLAIEHADFTAAIAEHRQPEVHGAIGLRSLAIANGLMESELLGRSLTVDEVLTQFDLPYQQSLRAVVSHG